MRTVVGLILLFLRRGNEEHWVKAVPRQAPWFQPEWDIKEICLLSHILMLSQSNLSCWNRWSCFRSEGWGSSRPENAECGQWEPNLPAWDGRSSQHDSDDKSKSSWAGKGCLDCHFNWNLLQPILHLTFNDSPLKQPTCTFVIFLKVNLLILETCLEGERQFEGRLGRRKVSSFVMKSVLIEEGGIRMNCKIQKSRWDFGKKKENKKKKKQGKNVN